MALRCVTTGPSKALGGQGVGVFATRTMRAGETVAVFGPDGKTPPLLDLAAQPQTVGDFLAQRWLWAAPGASFVVPADDTAYLCAPADSGVRQLQQALLEVSRDRTNASDADAVAGDGSARMKVDAPSTDATTSIATSAVVDGAKNNATWERSMPRSALSQGLLVSQLLEINDGFGVRIPSTDEEAEAFARAIEGAAGAASKPSTPSRPGSLSSASNLAAKSLNQGRQSEQNVDRIREDVDAASGDIESLMALSGFAPTASSFDKASPMDAAAMKSPTPSAGASLREGVPSYQEARAASKGTKQKKALAKAAKAIGLRTRQEHGLDAGSSTQQQELLDGVCHPSFWKHHKTFCQQYVKLSPRVANCTLEISERAVDPTAGQLPYEERQRQRLESIRERRAGNRAARNRGSTASDSDGEKTDAADGSNENGGDNSGLQGEVMVEGHATVELRVLRPIARGEELLVSYGLDHWKQEMATRVFLAPESWNGLSQVRWVEGVLADGEPNHQPFPEIGLQKSAEKGSRSSKKGAAALPVLGNKVTRQRATDDAVVVFAARLSVMDPSFLLTLVGRAMEEGGHAAIAEKKIKILEQNHNAEVSTINAHQTAAASVAQEEIVKALCRPCMPATSSSSSQPPRSAQGSQRPQGPQGPQIGEVEFIPMADHTAKVAPILSAPLTVRVVRRALRDYLMTHH